jgi:hypothetical protein
MNIFTKKCTFGGQDTLFMLIFICENRYWCDDDACKPFNYPCVAKTVPP